MKGFVAARYLNTYHSIVADEELNARNWPWLQLAHLDEARPTEGFYNRLRGSIRQNVIIGREEPQGFEYSYMRERAVQVHYV